jgi:exopolysaccharide biosynthesis polyprenyl glycosylphosphotransferase
MLKHAYTRAGDAVIRLADVAALIFSLPVAARVLERFGPQADKVAAEAAAFPVEIALLLWVASAWFHRVYDERPRAGTRSLVRIGRALAVVALLFLTGAAIDPRFAAGHGLLAAYVAIAFVLISAIRAAFRLVSIAARRRGYSLRRYAVVGTSTEGREVVEAMETHPEWGFDFAGFVTVGAEQRGSRGPTLGGLADLGRILEEEILDEIVFAVPREQFDLIEPAVQLCQEQGVEVRISLDMLRFGPSSMRLTVLNDLPMVVFSRTPSDTLALAAKRLFDIVLSGLAMVFMAPVFLGIGIAIKVGSPGPVFFRQKRVGRNGRTFPILKFRSMYQDAEARLEALKAQNEMSGPVFKMKEDPRVTAAGRFLRKTSLDEFPQFWNVLMGDMSIVGPRPPLPSEVRQYKRWQRRRLSVKPGITCIWQISGRNNIDFDRWMELDLEYIDTWSLWGDLKIFLRTIPAVLLSRGAS